MLKQSSSYKPRTKASVTEMWDAVFTSASFVCSALEFIVPSWYFKHVFFTVKQPPRSGFTIMTANGPLVVFGLQEFLYWKAIVQLLLLFNSMYEMASPSANDTYREQNDVFQCVYIFCERIDLVFPKVTFPNIFLLHFKLEGKIYPQQQISFNLRFAVYFNLGLCAILFWRRQGCRMTTGHTLGMLGN